jgi:hypothetical protein
MIGARILLRPQQIDCYLTDAISLSVKYQQRASARPALLPCLVLFASFPVCQPSTDMQFVPPG